MRKRLGLALITTALLLMPLRCMADEAGHVEEAKPVTLADVALADAREILSQSNSCSGFFGGAEEAVTVLDALAGRIKYKELPDRRLGIRMIGDDGLFISYRTGYQYRLFKQVIINTNGPFYNSGNPSAPIPQCGSFGPNTREARVLMLLHELGHLIKGADGRWLLVDDGHNYQRSQSNTSLIESRCLAQIKALRLDEEKIFGGEGTSSREK